MFVHTPQSPHAPLNFSAEIPSWLRGTLIRNSPAGYQYGHDQQYHWNDGFAQLHRWRIGPSVTGEQTSHMSRFLNTSSYWKAVKTASLPQVGYGTPAHPGARPHVPVPCCDERSPVEAANTMPHVEGDDSATPNLEGMSDRYAVNPMVNVWKFDNKMMATTDQNMFVEFDPDTLETKGDVNDGWSSKSTDPITKKGLMGIGVAHGRYDRLKKEHTWLEIDLGIAPLVSPAKYNVWTYQETGYNGTGPLPPRKLLGTFTDSKTSFIHSFGMTDNYLIFIQCPMHYSFAKFPFAKTVVDTVSWDPETATKFHIMERSSGKLVKTIESTEGAWFVYHVLNAFEDEHGRINIDFSRYHNASLIIRGMYLSNLIDDPQQYVPTYEQARYTRCVIDADVGTSACKMLVDKTAEMATFNWEHKHMKPHRYVWAASLSEPNLPWKAGKSDFIDQLVKIDVAEGKIAASWSEPGYFVCEPLFQQAPNAQREDDGVLMFVAYDSTADKSMLMLLNGTTLSEIARAPMSGRMPAHFHGKWLPDGKDYAIGL